MDLSVSCPNLGPDRRGFYTHGLFFQAGATIVVTVPDPSAIEMEAEVTATSSPLTITRVVGGQVTAPPLGIRTTPNGGEAIHPRRVLANGSTYAHTGSANEGN